ncbi:efflux RND transporter periplasmic adaptor subunit [Pseudaeromonas sp. ZJS20]|uniref:efflux RND transporter periplasmic adaptor subunit n=1 Tax=Pseudaeromonas aegiceratis TaxID=3153928 RepID=UPI00390CB9DC
MRTRFIPLLRAGSLLLLATLSQVPIQAAETPATLTLRPQTEARWWWVDGQLEPVDQGTVAAQTQGRITALNVDVNDMVEAGEVLLEITSTEQAAGLSRAEAALAAAQAQQLEADNQLVRMQALLAKGTVSRREYDSAKAAAQAARGNVNQAKAAVVQAKEAVGYTRVLAPYAGVVSARHVSVGETVTPGQPLLSGFALTHMRVVADVPQRLQGQLQTQQGFSLRLADGETLALTDYQIYRYADPASHSFRLRLPLPAQDGMHWLPGEWVKLGLPLGQRQALRLPQSAILQQSELTAVYVMTPKGPQLRQVKLGDSREGEVEILAGLSAGETVLQDAWAQVSAQGGHYAP